MSKRYLKLAAILKKLLFEKDMRSADLARAVDLPPPTVHRLVTGKSTRPYESSLKPIADFFSLEVEQLIGEKPIGGDHNDYIQKKELIKEKSKKIFKTKIIEVNYIPWLSILENNTEKNLSTVPFWGEISKKAYATTMPDSSMEPFIPKNALIFLDPQVQFADRSYILVKLHETGACLIRQILIDAEHRYLKPLNPDLSGFKMRILNKKDEIMACLVEVRHNCRPDL